jgi:hypothetical protein
MKTKLYEIDGLLSYRRAELLGGIVRSLTDKQKASLAKMVFNNSATWPELENQVDKKSLSHTAHVAVMTYASEMFSWYAGNVEADVYFCPERHATYFGSFFMKEASVDKDKVLDLSRKYGELDGEISYYYATAFARIAKTLTADQKKTLLKLRNLDAKFTCKGAYLYSRAVAMPEVPNTDFLFAAASFSSR